MLLVLCVSVQQCFASAEANKIECCQLDELKVSVQCIKLHCTLLIAVFVIVLDDCL